MALVKALWNGLKKIVKFLLPFTKGSKLKGAGTTLRWILLIVLFIAALVGLYFLNEWLLVRNHMLPDVGDIIRALFLDILFLLVVAVAIVGYYVWILFWEEEETDYPDIDAAWEEAKEALQGKGIDVKDLPLFFVLGRPLGQMTGTKEEKRFNAEGDFFKRAGLNLNLFQVPNRPDSSVHVYTNGTSIFVTCPGVSALAEQLSILDGEKSSSEEAFENESDYAATIEPPTGTILPGAHSPSSGIGTIIGGHRPMKPIKITGPKKIPPMKEEVAKKLEGRLRHLCRLVKGDREPYCALNGILMLLSTRALETDEYTAFTGGHYVRDLTVMHSVFEVHCPKLVLITDLENIPGCHNLIKNIDPEMRKMRFGQSFPFTTNKLAGEDLFSEIKNAVRSCCGSYLHHWVLTFYTVERAQADHDAVTTENSKLFLFLNEMRNRQERICTIVDTTLRETYGPSAGGDDIRFGGCYLAATGDVNSGDYAFVHGVFDKLERELNSVKWTGEHRSDDEKRGVTATGILVGVIVGWAALVLWIGWLVWSKLSS